MPNESGYRHSRWCQFKGHYADEPVCECGHPQCLHDDNAHGDYLYRSGVCRSADCEGQCEGFTGDGTLGNHTAVQKQEAEEHVGEMPLIDGDTRIAVYKKYMKERPKELPQIVESEWGLEQAKLRAQDFHTRKEVAKVLDSFFTNKSKDGTRLFSSGLAEKVDRLISELEANDNKMEKQEGADISRLAQRDADLAILRAERLKEAEWLEKWTKSFATHDPTNAIMEMLAHIASLKGDRGN